MRILRWPLGQVARLWMRYAPLWPFGQRRVLLLEDDVSMQRLVAALLRSLRVKVDVFGNGRAVIARIAAEGHQYDALLLDLMMPHEGGLSVLRNMRSHHSSLIGRVILLTGSGSGVTDPWSELVFAVIHKPFNAATLLSTVEACLRQPDPA